MRTESGRRVGRRMPVVAAWLARIRAAPASAELIGRANCSPLLLTARRRGSALCGKSPGGLLARVFAEAALMRRAGTDTRFAGDTLRFGTPELPLASTVPGRPRVGEAAPGGRSVGGGGSAEAASTVVGGLSERCPGPAQDASLANQQQSHHGQALSPVRREAYAPGDTRSSGHASKNGEN